MSSSSNISNSLPLDIIEEEILTRLPVKSLKRFQCVSQSWNNLIRNPLFVSKHLIINQSKGAQILVNRSTGTQILVNQIMSYNPSDYQNYTSDYSLLGFCNGLLCVKVLTTSRIIIWNPASKDYIILPQKKTPNSSLEEECYGFGYDAKSDDYIVCHYLEAFFNIYSVRENSWRRIEEFRYKIIYRVYGTFLSGSIYWLAAHKLIKSSNYFIIAFDLVDKQFRELPLPQYEENKNLNHIVLDTLDECLCSLRRINIKQVELWTMKEDGLQTSWTKLYTIRMDRPLMESKLLYYNAASANLLLKDGYTIIFYDTKERNVIRKRTKSLNITEHDMGALTYFESLVSPVMHGCLVNNDARKSLFQENMYEHVLKFSFTTNEGSYQCNLVTYEKTPPKENI
ncbi:hypothetical protein AQUCO_00200431v1 [Aquilegia coerulea]|uniref:F-box domain-containing protein n=1 Tax=Aquilegia coerulea TaxID=218851 RepID=A0A2G5F344_AQUCA|nr:hypothetical protein AQUCO_00200431v1 [Aquilegia coerulea]